MSSDYSDLPAELPVPEDDGAADHLLHLDLPNVELPSTDGSRIDLSQLHGCWVVYIYPMTGRPGVALPEGWNEIPGARGCTPEPCGFRDHHAELGALNTNVLGLSAQDREHQREARQRLHLPFQLVCDSEFRLKDALDLPTFDTAGRQFYRRLTIIARDGRIDKVFYPIFPPHRHADEVLFWLQDNARQGPVL